jgi:hypothetical protein
MRPVILSIVADHFRENNTFGDLPILLFLLQNPVKAPIRRQTRSFH